MDQMGIIAHEINGDISIVTSYQLFRILFILLFVPPLLKMLFKAVERHQVRKNKLNQLNKKAALK
ncbi:putative ammonia monooxygenase [compost metagenome]